MVVARDEIDEILGPVDDTLAAEIAATEVTSAELLRAKTIVLADDAVHPDQQQMSPRLSAAIAILEEADLASRDTI